MDDVEMSENSSEPPCQIRRRTNEGVAPLNLEVGCSVSEASNVDRGTPSPCTVKFISDSDPKSSSSTLLEFRKKQQSFEIQIEDCDEEEIIIDSDEEDAGGVSRSESPMQPLTLPDYGAGNVNIKETPQSTGFLQVYAKDTECITDVSDAESDTDPNEDTSHYKGKSSKK